MDEEQRTQYLQQQRNLSRQKRENMDEEQRAQYLQQQRNLSRQRRENMDEEQTGNGKVSVTALQPYPEVLRDLLEGNDQESTSFRKKSGITNVHSPLRLLESNCAFFLEEVIIASASKARLITQRQICTLVIVNRNMGNCIL
ncbi:hypothetical protein FHG87_024449 [Trinorchestia longiramus]|nr:hypothetical protein FHG87_024449 [Trinorchestia longiramus]